MRIPFNSFRNALPLGAMLAAALSTPVSAAPEPKTRLVDCGSGSCLLVTGQRPDTESPVSINGHAVAAQGARQWRVRVPVETVRAWSAPFARSVTVSVADVESQAVLPIGLLGHIDDLAFLTVSAK